MKAGIGFGRGLCRAVFQSSSIFVPTAVLTLACSPKTPGPTAQRRELEVELGPGAFDLTDPRVGLASLASYETVLTISFDGTREGSPLRWSAVTRLQAGKSPATRYLATTELDGSGQKAERFVAEARGVAYEWSADSSCSAATLDVARSPIDHLDPVAQLAGVLGAEEIGSESLSGRQARQFKFDERALAQSGLNKSVGELWVASEGGYVLRYRLTTTGDTAYFGDHTKGTLTTDYELTRIDQPLHVEVPKACPSSLVNAPMLPSRANVENYPGVLDYTTSAPVSDAVAFYKKELATLGWKTPARFNPMAQALDDPEVRAALTDPKVREAMKAMGLNLPTQSPQVASNDNEWYEVFSKGRDTLRVRITRGDSATRVIVLTTSGN